MLQMGAGSTKTSVGSCSANALDCLFDTPDAVALKTNPVNDVVD
jgi:hypothetical protein